MRIVVADMADDPKILDQVYLPFDNLDLITNETAKNLTTNF